TASELRAAAATFYAAMGATGGDITARQQAEVHERAMRVVLKLDSMEGLPPEFRSLRKHLTARALSLQDQVTAAYEHSAARPPQQGQQQGQQPSLSRAASSVLPPPPPPSPEAEAEAEAEAVVADEKEEKEEDSPTASATATEVPATPAAAAAAAAATSP
ncbi:hypothetical protein Agub_g14769, partial [Astrephomene gubernaculifera]